MDKGEALNRRVWTLFERAGFQTKPNSDAPAEHVVQVSARKRRPVDLYATEPELGVKIVGSNKAGSLKGWMAHVNDYAELGAQAGAKKVLFVVTGVELAPEDIAYVREKKCVFWGEDELSYYEAVTEAIKEYAKYEIIKALGIKTTEQKDTHRVLALRLRQPLPDSEAELFMFTLAPERLLKTCFIYRRAQGSADAYQRMLRRKRLPKIRRFISRADAILPTNIIVYLSEKVTVDEISQEDLRDQANHPITLSSPSAYDLVTLNVPMEYASLELIDGQHRLYGFVEADPATRRQFNLVVLGVRGLVLKQRRDTFVGINDNARRMDANLVSYLKYTEDDVACERDSELMAIRLVVDLNKTTPFKRAIRVLDIGTQKITLKGFSGYDLRGLLGPKGLLRKYYPNNKPKEYLQVLRIYFSTIRTVFGKEWKDPTRYIIATNRGISAFLKLLRSILKTEKAAIKQTVLAKYLRGLKAGWDTWDFGELRGKYVGSGGWKQFHRDLVRVIRSKFPDFRE